jgi:hypothetical protein
MELAMDQRSSPARSGVSPSAGAATGCSPPPISRPCAPPSSRALRNGTTARSTQPVDLAGLGAQRWATVVGSARRPTTSASTRSRRCPEMVAVGGATKLDPDAGGTWLDEQKPQYNVPLTSQGTRRRRVRTLPSARGGRPSALRSGTARPPARTGCLRRSPVP